MGENPVPGSRPFPNAERGKQMRMTDRQINMLADAETPTATVCYHGVRLIHECPERGTDEMPLFVLRFIGHLLSDHEAIQPEVGDVVPDSSLFTVDFPMHVPTIGSLMAKLGQFATQAFACDMASDISQEMPPEILDMLNGKIDFEFDITEVDPDALPEDMPEPLRRLLGDVFGTSEPDDGWTKYRRNRGEN